MIFPEQDYLFVDVCLGGSSWGPGPLQSWFSYRCIWATSSCYTTCKQKPVSRQYLVGKFHKCQRKQQKVNDTCSLMIFGDFFISLVEAMKKPQLATESQKCLHMRQPQKSILLALETVHCCVNQQSSHDSSLTVQGSQCSPLCLSQDIEAHHADRL